MPLPWSIKRSAKEEEGDEDRVGSQKMSPDVQPPNLVDENERATDIDRPRSPIMKDPEVQDFLKIIYDPKDAQIDIVAVHGLNPTNKSFHAEKTWTASNSNMWLKDFLPISIPTARVLLFGYNANVAFQTSTAGVRQQAENLLNRLKGKRRDAMKRPIIFICHSLGGLVVKRALVMSKATNTYSSIKDATYGIAFFGTPHRGGNKVPLGSIAASIARIALRNPASSFMDALRKDSLFSEDLIQDFRQQLSDYYILSFFETQPFKKYGLIVDEKSATLGLPSDREKQIGLSGNHSDICKFESIDSDDYEQVRDNIEELATMVLKATEEKERLKALGVDSPEQLSLIPLAQKDSHSNVDSRSQQLMDWISVPEVDAKKDFPEQIQGTGQWLFELDSFQSWVNGVNNVMWWENQTTDNIMAHLLWQVIQQARKISPEVTTLYDKCQNGSPKRRPTASEWSSLLRECLGVFPKSFLLIDALDECSNKTREGVLKETASLSTVSGLRILITSRNRPPSDRPAFQGIPSIQIHAQDDDIKIYLENHIDNEPALVCHINKDPTLRTKIITTIIGKCKGIEKHSLGAVDEALDTLPEDLDDMYHETIQRIKSQKDDAKDLARNIIIWLTYAIRPLSLPEIRHALAIKSDQKKFNERYQPYKEGIISVCAGLVTIDPESSIVRLVHYTAHEYFKKLREGWFPDATVAEAEITTTCITYLSFDDFGSGYCKTDAKFEERLRSYPLYEYAARNWSHHARDAVRTCQDVVEFLKTDNLVQASYEALTTRVGAIYGRPRHLPEGVTGIHLAACLGLRETTKTLLNLGCDPNPKDSKGQTPLAWATKMGHRAVVEELLKNKLTDVNTTDNKDRTPLWTAARKDDERITQMLLERGATPDKMGTKEEGMHPWGVHTSRTNALHEAAQNGNKAVFQWKKVLLFNELSRFDDP
ncbi:P-loop containing nucleoside triphosphate hydrolase [Fusarium austroafricanum]|uniref:P-loop containing nucleoside triphosphate hydrolase n=1 Tax=Fusarium austroafricanum TaxID=2364996 RepID=A0A8H4KLP7_9HYPO|nr:P-loop containing nucleoside triphosphate hydrolase [Fusarium austroafricanum]